MKHVNGPKATHNIGLLIYLLVVNCRLYVVYALWLKKMSNFILTV